MTEKIDLGSEDCLFLNVYTKEINPHNPLPVMIFIHGGGFKSGSGNVALYGPDYLIEHGVVLVTINYRLEIFGFLCLDTEEVPGNAGLKDQVAALKWIQKNIDKFGGDPNNVTIIGESAGGASAAAHMLSPMSKGLFKRVISMSGVPICDWALAFEPRRRAFALGKLLGCNTKDPQELLDFLQNLPVDKLIDKNPNIIAFEDHANNFLKMYHFTPVVEKDFGKDHFLTEHPVDAVKNGHFHKADLLGGYTSKEGILSISILETLLPIYEKYEECLVPGKIILKSTPGKVLELAEKIRKDFFGIKPLSIETIKEAVTYFSESSFLYDIDKFIKFASDAKCGNVYKYRFSCFSERNIFGTSLGEQYDIQGVSHLDDLMYIFDVKMARLKLDKNSSSYKMIQQTCKLFTNFAKYGTPTPDLSLNVNWPEYDTKEEYFMDIAETLTVDQHLNAKCIAYWDNIYKEANIDY
ncbi:acetylcholinesterase-like isoform X2 [Pectinophora gossypiella]|nr:acetylcholinesterase-like isoform X2 [Pectinophora gossypiella]